jgi:hypothetical protein
MNNICKIYVTFLIIGMLIVLLAYFTIDANIEKFSIQYQVLYPDYDETRKNLASKEYFSFFKLLDAQARGIKLNYDDFNQKYESSIIEISDNEKKIFTKFYSDIVESIPIKKRHHLLIPNIKIVKFSGVENDFPHTHYDIIFLNKSFFDDLGNYQSLKNKIHISRAKTLIHEILHIKQRQNPTLYDSLFNQWGFQSISLEYMKEKISKNVLSRIRINPDELPDYRFWVWKQKIIPLVIYSSFKVSSINDVNQIAIDWNNPDKYNKLENNTEYNDYFRININNYHPNEILAEYQATYFLEIYSESDGYDVSDHLLKSEGYRIFKQFQL